MCGIAGYVGEGSKARLDKMLSAIKSRGPDDRGTWISGQVGLGNNRLSIIDLSKNGHQPMFNEDKRIGIVYNGEIYNFQEIKKTLVKHKFSSNTDTEVILHAYEEWGPECLKKLNGMFAFVIYDKKKNILFGARDRLGEKPLKYYWDGNFFAFASEVKGLFPMLPQKPEMDAQAINDFLTLQYVPAPYTGFRNIFKLPPAHYFIFKNNKLQIKRYWDLRFDNKLDLTGEELEDVLLEELKRSVESRLIADVPVGVLLSGGVDSSAVVALASRVSGKKLKTFSIGFTDKEFDESEYANLIANQYQTNHRSFEVDHKMMGEVFEHLADYYDEPFADNSAIPTLILSKLTSRYVKVALSGDGGDESFAGYERYSVVSFSDVYAKVPPFTRTALSLVSKSADLFVNTKFTGRLSAFTKTFELPFYEKYLYYSCFFDNKTKNGLYSPEFYERVKKFDTFNIFQKPYNPNLSNIDNALKFDMRSYLPEDLLFKTDIASMAHSLELRAPFLNHELVELTAKIPHHLKVNLFDKKHIFKKVLEKNDLVPRSILNRPKRGFVAPIDKWLKGDFKNFVVEALTSKKFRDADIFDAVQLEKYLQNYFQGRQVSSNNIFALLSLALWINKYF